MPPFQRVPPRRPVSWAQTLRLWLALALALALLAALVAWSERLPTAAPRTAPPDTFSAERARPTLSVLADSAGHRLPGTPASARARAHLLARLRALPNVEVEVQDVVGTRPSRWGPTAYRAQNVLARIPGRRREAVMLAAHYDSPAESVGAADDAVAVAAAVEVARALAQGPTLEHSVIVNINDAEEQGLIGSHAFLQHPWARDVRAFVNLESAGNAGKAILFQAGPRNSWLTRRYAASVPHPYGSVIGQDIFQSGLIPSSTDFEVYARVGGLRGLDVAFYRGGYAYHTALDQAAAVAPGSLQHMGADALALVRALAAGPLPGDVGGRPSVYYDVLGATMLAYDQALAWVVTAAAVALLLATARLARRRYGVPGRAIAVAFVITLVGAVLAVAVTVALAAVIPYALHRPHGWLAHPLRAVAGYGGTALAVLAAAQWLLAGRTAGRLDRSQRWVAAWIAALALHLALLVALTVAGIGSAYLFAWWVLGGAAGLALLGREDARWRTSAAVGLLPGAVLTLQTAVLLVALFVPVAGRFPLPIPFDLVLAAIVATSTVVLALAPIALLQRGERLGAATALAGAVGVGGLALLATTFPYTPERPQRLAVVHESAGGTAALLVDAGDYVGPALAVAAAGAGPLGPPATRGGRVRYPAPPLDVAPPRLELVAERRTARGRELDLRLDPAGAYAGAVRVAGTREVAWRVAGDRAGAWHRGPRLGVVAAPEGGWRITLALPDTEPVILEVTAVHHTPSPAARELMRRFPAWTTSYAESVVRARQVM